MPPTDASLHALINSLNVEGWIISSLGQFPNTLHWRAVLSSSDEDGIYTTPDADAPTLLAALLLARSLIPRARFLPYLRPSLDHLLRPPFSLASLLPPPPPPTFTSPLRRKLRP